MTTNPLKDWNPETYARFRGFRLRPALDLLAQVPRLPSGDVVDLGCGAGAVGPTLATQFGRPPIGIDSSPAMLAEARSTRAYGVLRKEDASHWQPDRPPGLIFSNALCHWLPDHDALFPRLARVLAPGGTLAVQMPRQYGAPSHALLRELAVRLYPERFDFADWSAPVGEPEWYHRLLSPLGDLQVWETDYLQHLPPARAQHPVQAFTASTAMRPFLAKLATDELPAFCAAYDVALSEAYPLAADGSVLMPFRRLFFVLTT
ncbi:MAG: methyltransferase domain-containing protein, partial [Pseudomonadota bacterium]